MSVKSSGDIARVNSKEPVATSPNKPVSGSPRWRGGRVSPSRVSPSLALRRSRSQGVAGSTLVRSTHRRPPGRSTLAISGTALGRSSQCHAEEMSTASALAPASGSASPLPWTTCTPGDRWRSTAAIR
jgi:hypothetical protein